MAKGFRSPPKIDSCLAHTHTQFASSLPCGDWQGMRFGSESVAVNTQLCLSASEDFDFLLTAWHIGVWGRQQRAWVWGEEGPVRGGREKLCRDMLALCVPTCGRLSHCCFFSLSGTPWGGCFYLLLVDRLNHKLQQLRRGFSPPSKRVAGFRAEFLKNGNV